MTLRPASRNQGERMLSHFKSPWPEDPVPRGEPHWTYYEVVVARDVVTRIVDEFQNGSLTRNSNDLDQNDAHDQRDSEHRSLVHGPFLDFAQEHLLAMPSEEFDALWERAVDTSLPSGKYMR